jgi:feruloyl esterase
MRRVPTNPAADWAGSATPLEETHRFGSNPGNLRMFRYVPSSRPAAPALVVVLHGCKQTAAGYCHGAGWATLAERYGFVLLLPQQQPANNPNGCFNWFQPGDTQRHRGEAMSIRQMIEQIADTEGIDRERIFITGLSAGGAMTSVMLACYPEVFAAGAIIAGLPYGAAGNVQQAFESMFQSPPRSAAHWGNLVRDAAPHDGPWPRISIWHGSADTTVIPANARELLKQWTGVHRVPVAPSREDHGDGFLRQVWVNPEGEELIEYYAIPNMGHGAPVAAGDAEHQCGAAGPFLLEVGISSSQRIAAFFALTNGGARAGEPLRTTSAERSAPYRANVRAESEPAEMYRRITDHMAPGLNTTPRSGGPIDVGAVIAKALTAAGLMKKS